MQLEKSSRITGYDYFLPATAFDPLHRGAAQNAFTDFVNRMTVWVNDHLVSRI